MLNFCHTLCVRVATCACRSSTSRGAWVAFENKNKPVLLPIVVTMCTVGGRLATIIFFGKAPSKVQLESIFQVTIAARIMDRSTSDIVDGKVSKDIEAKKRLSKRNRLR